MTEAEVIYGSVDSNAEEPMEIGELGKFSVILAFM